MEALHTYQTGQAPGAREEHDEQLDRHEGDEGGFLHGLRTVLATAGQQLISH